MKTNKHQTLLFVSLRQCVRGKDVAERFGYSPGTARSYLSYLRRHGLLARLRLGYVLTEAGRARLAHFEVVGCADDACPRCSAKTGDLTCRRCGHVVPKHEARILKDLDLWLVVRHAGVYCPNCWALILSEPLARLLGIQAEE